MPRLSFDDLYSFADALAQPVSIAVDGAADVTVLEALRTGADRGWVVPYLVGKETDIRQLAGAKTPLQGFQLVDSEDSAKAAVALVRRGEAKLLMKGQLATPTLLKAMLDPEHGLRTEKTICQIVLIELGPTGRRFLLADTGICVQPTLTQKIDILESAVTVARTLGDECPRVAVMAATETVTPAMPETLDAFELQRRAQAGEIAGCTVRGPLSFDLAYCAEAAVKKKVDDPAGAAADIMLFPNLLSANLTVKAIMYTAPCRFGGVLCGAACPVVFMSRADTTATRLNSLALALKTATSASNGR